MASIVSIGGVYLMYKFFTQGIFKPLLFLMFAAISASLYLIFICIFMCKNVNLLLGFVKMAKK